MDQINKKPEDQKYDLRTENTKKHKIVKYEKYCFEPNIQTNFHLVNIDVLIEKVKNFVQIFLV